MAHRDINALVANLANLGKQAASPESATDPGVQGTMPDTVEKEKLIAPLPGQSASLETTPIIATGEPAGKTKVEEGDVAGQVPSGQPFVVSGAAAKNAAFIQSSNALSQKLASLFTTPATTAPAPAAPSKEASESLPGDVLLKVAFHLMSTASGQHAINGALDEIMGIEARTELVKKAADEHVEFLRNYTAERLNQAHQEDLQRKQAAAQEQAAAEYRELTKNATPQQIQDMKDTSLIIKTAEEIFADNAIAHQAFLGGISAAYKVAAAMDGGAPPEAAAAEAAGPQEGAPSAEELMQAIAALVEQGQIKPEEAQQLIAELQAAAGGGAPGGDPSGAAGMPPGGDPSGGGGGMPPGADPSGGGMPPGPPAGGPPPDKAAAVEDFLSKVAAAIA